MFTPFIQYSIDGPSKTPSPQGAQNEHTIARQADGPQRQDVLDIAAVVGCLDRSSSGTWMLSNGSEPVVSQTQTTSSAELNGAATMQLGNHAYELLGVTAFSPSSDKGLKVAVKGVLIRGAEPSRLNVTSMQKVGSGCS